MKYIYLIAGGSIGTLLRFLTSSWMLEAFPTSKFPWGTFFVNLTGCFLIGMLAAINQSGEFNINVRLFLFAGLLGGFTTYSGYAIETYQLIKTDQISLALTYILATTLLGILLAAFGFWISSVLSVR